MPGTLADPSVLEQAKADDNSVATLYPATVDALQLFRGDTIIVLGGKERRDHLLELRRRRRGLDPVEVFYVSLQPYFLEAYSYRPSGKAASFLFVMEWNR
ncbi:hypothetical protein BC835DRAFT_1419888 [Cytidiella melzeri]|nr:hypothetical protein BC835DRAFT_1419888 [Cytidiella melzeri]